MSEWNPLVKKAGWFVYLSVSAVGECHSSSTRFYWSNSLLSGALHSNFIPGILAALNSGLWFLRSPRSWHSLDCFLHAQVRKLSLRRDPEEGGVPLRCFYSLRDHSLALFHQSCVIYIYIYIFFFFFLWWWEGYSLIPVKLLKQNAKPKQF